jgi:photosystem II stability/assembly factor-like uncharacterized protein
VYGIWKSSDDGNTWTKVGGATFGRASGPVKMVTFHPENENVMYAAAQRGIYLSPDRGETWTSINGRLPFTTMNAVTTDGQTLYAGSAGAGVFSGGLHPLIHTADWMRESQLAVPVENIQITLHPNDPQTLYATGFPGGVFKTSDGGNSWSERNHGLPSFAVADPSRQGRYTLAVAPSAPDVLYLSLFGHGVYRSDDGALTWRPVNGDEGQVNEANVAALLVHPDDPDIVYVATDTGVWRTVNGGRSWGEFSEGLPPSGDVFVLTLGATPVVTDTFRQLYAGTRGYGLYARPAFHQAGDDAWRPLTELDDWGAPWPLWDDWPLRQHTSLLIRPSGSNTFYAGAFPGGIFKTTDAGSTWREANVGFENAGVLTLVSHPDDDQVLYAGTTNGIARSIDGAATWHPWDVGWPPQQWVLSIAHDPTNPEVLYACSKNGEAFGRGRDGFRGFVMKSTDGGANWFEITTGLDLDQAFYQVLVDRLDPRIIYLATQGDGVYISRNGGETWTTWNEGLWNRVAGSDGATVPQVLSPAADGRLLYFGTTGTGVWRRPAAGTLSE